MQVPGVLIVFMTFSLKDGTCVMLLFCPSIFIRRNQMLLLKIHVISTSKYYTYRRLSAFVRCFMST